MRRMGNLLASLGFVAGSVFACSGRDGGTANSASEPTTDKSLRVEIRTVHNEFLEGSSIEIDFYVRNVGNAPISILRSLEPEGHFVRFEIFDEAEETVYLSPSIPREDTADFLKDVLTLDPAYLWGKRFRFERAKLLGVDGPLFAPGKYVVKATYFNSRRVCEDMPVGHWKSNEVQVQVVPRDGQRGK